MMIAAPILKPDISVKLLNTQAVAAQAGMAADALSSELYAKRRTYASVPIFWERLQYSFLPFCKQKQ